jgi:pimeloyl-ACP methyl ester carboxylesterase
MGLGVSRFWWPTGLVAELIKQGFHVVAYDQRDAGQSTHLPDTGSSSPIAAVLRRRSTAYSAEDMTDDAIAVMDALGWPSAHLFGHSMGGQIAQRTALRHPGRVRSVTSSASLPSDVTGLKAARYVHTGLVAKFARLKFPEGHDGDIALGLAVTRLVASPGYPFDEAEARARIERDLAAATTTTTTTTTTAATTTTTTTAATTTTSSSVRDTRAQSRQAGAKWRGARLSELCVPTLVLHGDADPLLRPSAARRTAAAIKDARLLILPGVGHDLPKDVWPQVAAEVRTLADRAGQGADPAAGPR